MQRLGQFLGPRPCRFGRLPGLQGPFLGLVGLPLEALRRLPGRLEGLFALSLLPLLGLFRRFLGLLLLSWSR